MSPKRSPDPSAIHSNLLFLTESTSPFLESYRRVCRKIMYFHKKNNVKSIGITSSQVAEGKTLTSINLSFAIAEDSTKRVALVDCDFRRPQVANYLGLPRDVGLADVIREEANLKDVLFSMGEEIPNLEVFPAGILEENITASFFQVQLAPVLNDLKNIYDFVVVDNPPILPVSDEEFLADLLDAVILVVRAGKTSRDLVQTALESMEGKNVVGVVFNGLEKQLSNYHQYGYYNKQYYRNDIRK